MQVSVMLHSNSSRLIVFGNKAVVSYTANPVQDEVSDYLQTCTQVVCDNNRNNYATPRFCYVYYSDDEVRRQGSGKENGGSQSTGRKQNGGKQQSTGGKDAGGKTAGRKDSGGATTDSQAGAGRRRLHDGNTNCAGCLQACNCQNVGMRGIHVPSSCMHVPSSGLNAQHFNNKPSCSDAASALP